MQVISAISFTKELERESLFASVSRMKCQAKMENVQSVPQSANKRAKMLAAILTR